MRHLIYLILLLFGFSCTTPKAIERERQPEKGRDATGAYFIEKEDGQKIPFAKITRPSVGNHTEDRIVADGTKMDAPVDLVAFQNETGYYKFLKDPKPTKYWKGQFIQRLRAGRISLYYRSTFLQGPGAYYYFEKDKGPLTRLLFENFSAALIDKPEVLAEFERLYPKRKITADRQLQEDAINLPRLVEMYNQ
jgi:hypothetical protein